MSLLWQNVVIVLRCIPSISAMILAVLCTASAKPKPEDSNRGNFGGPSYSSLDQINRKNVHQLKLAWTYHTHDNYKNIPLECRSTFAEGRLYMATQMGRVVALDPFSGKEIWSCSATKQDPGKSIHQKASRGVAFWSDGKTGGLRRVLYGTPNGRVFSMDARSGQLDPAFNVVDLHAELGSRWNQEPIGISAAPTIYKDLLYVGIASGESTGAAPGHVMAFSVRTGKRIWTFHVIPQGKEFGIDTWRGDSWKDGYAAGAWNGYTIDTTRGILFAATGSAAPDFDGSGRIGNNLFANCVIAIDAKTGKRLWHFQTVHHDLWDHDNASAPTLCRVKRNGKYIDAVAQVTKTGFCFVLDRVTGKPLFPVREVSAQPSSDPKEVASLTQPEPTLPPALSETLFTENSVTNVSAKSRDFVLDRIRNLSFGKKYLPPTGNGTVAVPGYFGGSPWSGASFDPRTDTLFVNTNNMPAIVANPANYSLLTDQDGYPGIKPPWGCLTAISLDTGAFKWRKALGEYAELTSRGVPQTGTMNLGGTLSTGGDLVFVGATCDQKFRAFDASTGKVLWQTGLPASAFAAAETYMWKGRQYIVIAACGGGFGKAFGMDHGAVGDSVLCYAIPK